MFRKISLVLFPLGLAALVYWQMAGAEESLGEKLSLPLTRGPFAFLKFTPMTKPTAVIVFASGDGGWKSLEEEIACTLQARGYEVVGIDSALYAETNYDLASLQTDFTALANAVLAKYGVHPPPLIVGGYSMGAAQAIAVAGGPQRPPGLVGLLLVDPRSRGRYGLTAADRWDSLPTGPGTFGADEFTPAMTGLRIAQWHAANDTIDSRTWLGTLTVPHQEFDFPGAGHEYEVNRGLFLQQLANSVGWILSASPSEKMTAAKREVYP